MTEPDDYRVILMPFPGDVYACVRVDCDGYPTIYINEALSPDAQRRALAHELHHIENNDLYNHLTIEDAETGAMQAETGTTLLKSERELTDEEYVQLMCIDHQIRMHARSIAQLPLGERLATLRRLKHLSQADAAWCVQASEQAIRDYERGAAVPDQEMLTRLSLLYGEDLHGKTN